MEKEKHTIRKFKSKHSVYCLWGQCKNCSRIVDNKGIHDVEIYQVFECTEVEECENCNGDGYTKEDCPHCDGWGIIEERCLDCDGKGKVPDEFGEQKLIKEIDILAKKEVSADSSHD